jgi:hypothetical protein
MSSEVSHRATLKKAIDAAGVSPGGERWLMQALYPPGEDTNIAIPDASWRPSVRLSTRPSLVVGKPAGLSAGATWDMLIVSFPGDNNLAVVATAPSPANFASSTLPSVWSLSVLQVNGSAASVTKPLVTITRAAGGSTVVTANSYTVRSATETMSFRTTYKGLTVNMVSSSLYNGGSIMGVQHDTNYVLGAGFDQDTRAGVGNVLIVPAMGNWPLSEEMMAQMCPGAHIGPAHEGCYLPIRMLGPGNSFVESPVSFHRMHTTITGGLVSIVEAGGGTYSASRMSVSPVWDNFGGAAAGTFQSQPWWLQQFRLAEGVVEDIAYDSCATGVIIARGLHENASFTVQGYVGQQLIVDDSSPLRMMTSAAAQFDPRVSALYSELVYNVPFAYPAKDNLLGLTLPALATAARAITPWLLRGARALIGGVPKIAAPVARAAPYITPLLQAASGFQPARAPRMRARTARVQVPAELPPAPRSKRAKKARAQNNDRQQAPRKRK